MAEAYFNYMQSDACDSHPGTSAAKSPGGAYSADVTNTELNSMKLSAKTCRRVNNLALEAAGKSAQDRTLHVRQWLCNAGFMVKTDDSRLYSGGLKSRVPLDFTPSGLCPSPEAHCARAVDLPLAAACPTCWSAQRIQVLNSTRTRTRTGAKSTCKPYTVHRTRKL